VHVAGLEMDAAPAARPARVSAVSISLDQEMTTFEAGVMPGSILKLPASMVTLALTPALFPKNMLSTRLPAALKVRVSLALRERHSNRRNHPDELRQPARGPVGDRQSDRQR
jgi:hypothetical protein